MRFVTYLQDTEIKLGIQLDDWIVDLRRAHEYLIESKNIVAGGSYPNALSAELMPEINDRVSPFMNAARQTIRYIREAQPNIFAALKSKALLIPSNRITLKPPVMNPGKLICLGMNYPSPGSVEEQKPAYPVLFLKSSSTLIGHQQPIVLPRISEKVFCEGELAIVIGRRGKHIPLGDATSYVAGYTIANDVGARDLEQRTSQWATGKLPDTFCPMGPALVTSDEIPDPNNLAIRTHINAELVQSGNTSEMIFNAPYLISYISSIATLLPGDIILTGSPKSLYNQPAPMVFLKPEDQISIEIEGIGLLSNQAIEEEYSDV